jgi:hypothetical protein
MIRIKTLVMISGRSKMPDFVAEVLQISEVKDMRRRVEYASNTYL